MSGKSVKKSDQSNRSRSKQEWTLCAQCETLYISDKTSNEAQHQCLKSVHEIDPETSCFIAVKESIAYLSPVDHFKDVYKELQINKEMTIDFVYMNPITMKSGGISLGDRVLVKKSSSVICCTCWPSSQIELGQMALNKRYMILNGFNFDQNVLVQKMRKEEVKSADQINIEQVESSACRLDDAQDQDVQLVLEILRECYLNKILADGQHLHLAYMGQQLVFKIASVVSKKKKKNQVNDISKKLESLSLNGINHSEFYSVSQSTSFKLASAAVNEDTKNKNESGARVMFKDIGGLEKEIELVKEIFIDTFKFSAQYDELGIEFSKGVLLYGPKGCGKTMLAKAIMHESQCEFIELNVSEIYSKNYGESESKLKQVFDKAFQKAPCILFIDDIDTLCAKRESSSQELEKRLVSLFSTLLDQSKAKNVLLLGTTSKIDSIDTSLRRPGRLDKEIEIPIPTHPARLLILKKQLEKLKHRISQEELLDISQNCHGYVGADLQMLVQEAGLSCVKRHNSCITSSQNELAIEKSDFMTALRKIKPSAMREITFDIPRVQWSEIGGQHELKRKLQQAIIWPIKYADSFKRLNIKPPRGLLMYGPPGCSKTMIAKALATETGLNFIAVKGPELFSKWVGESERMVREIFRKAREAAPAIIFFDEIDAVAMERSNSSNKSNNVGDRVLAQMLNEMDGVENLTDVTIVAATNRPDMIDKALMRPGRLDRIVYVRLPDQATRREILELRLKAIPIEEDVNVEELVKATEGYSGAEIVAMCNEAAFLALENDINSTKLTRRDFQAALDLVKPRTSRETIEYFDNFSFK